MSWVKSYIILLCNRSQVYVWIKSIERKTQYVKQINLQLFEQITVIRHHF